MYLYIFIISAASMTSLQELRFSAQMLDAIVTVAMCTLSLKDVEAPQQLFETIVVLHGELYLFL